MPKRPPSALDDSLPSLLQPPKRSRRDVVTSMGDGTRPLYKEVKLAITRMLSSGDIRAGEAIPTEKQLCAHFGVSIGTIRRAIDELVAEHVLIRQQGRGTFLAPYSPERMLNYFFHIVRHDGYREVPIVQTLSFEEMDADAATAEALAVERGTRLFRAVNLMLMRGEPIVLDEVRIAKVMFPGLTEAVFVSRDSTIYGLYQSQFGINIIRTLDSLRAVPADPATAKRLGVALSTPLLEIVRVALTFEDKPVEWRRTLLHTDNYEYRNVLNADSA